jgi:hypothetical protein
MAWTYTLDTTVPAGSADPKTLDTIIQNHKKAWQERLNVDLYMPLTGTQVSDTAAGEHRKVTLRVQTSDPTNEADKGWIYTKDVDSKAELHWEDEDGNVKQITSGGNLKLDGGDVILANDSYLTATDNAGTGTVNLIKATTSDEVQIGAVTTLPDTSKLATSGAPVADEQIANKKYVDDHVQKYDSGWFAVSASTTYTKAHGLGSFPTIVQHWYSDTSDGTGDVVGLGTDNGDALNYSSNIVDIDSTNVKVRTGGFICRYVDASGVNNSPTSGYMKIVAVLIG